MIKNSTRLILFNRQLWTPANISGALALWLDAADFSTIVLNGSTVSAWRDKSGNSRHALMATAASQPTYAANTLNGRPALQFNGNQRMSANFSITPPYENWFVLQINGLIGHLCLFRDGIDESPNRIFMTINSTDSITIGSEGNSSLITGAGFSFPYGSPSIMSGIYNSSSSSILFNGTVLISGNAGTVTTNGLTIGGRFNGSAGNVNGFYFEHILVNRILSITDRQKIEGYFAHKWGLTANLPSDHPFKFTAPRT